MLVKQDEADYQKWLFDNWKELFPEYDEPEPKFWLGSGKERMELDGLSKNKKTNALVVVEIKIKFGEAYKAAKDKSEKEEKAKKRIIKEYFNGIRKIGKNYFGVNNIKLEGIVVFDEFNDGHKAQFVQGAYVEDFINLFSDLKNKVGFLEKTKKERRRLRGEFMENLRSGVKIGENIMVKWVEQSSK